MKLACLIITPLVIIGPPRGYAKAKTPLGRTQSPRDPRLFSRGFGIFGFATILVNQDFVKITKKQSKNLD